MTEPLPALQRRGLRRASTGAWLLSLLVIVGCAPASVPAAPATGSAAEGKLKAAVRARGELAAELAQAPHEDLRTCQTTAGDCLISVSEQREALVSRYYLNNCRDPEPEIQARCVIRELEQRGELTNLATYYEAENWCSRKLLECTSALASNAAHVAARQRIQDRRRQIEAAKTSAAAKRLPEFTQEKLAFVRGILPPAAQEACSSVATNDCDSALKGPRSEFEAELAKAPASYDAEHALSLYAAIFQAEAGCSTPELSCLSHALPQYGATPIADKLLQQNLTLLGKAQQLRTSPDIDVDAATQCLSEGVLKYGDRIVSIYRTYVHTPTALPLVQLLTAFVGMHQAQLGCLLHLAKPTR